MNRTDFDNLDLEEQIKYINSKLTGGVTLTRLCKNIGIGRTTVRDRAAKIGYAYDKISNQYIYDNSMTKVANDINKTLVISEKLNNKENDISQTFVTDKDLIKKLKGLSDNYNKIIDVLNWYENDKDKTNVIEVIQGIKITLPEEEDIMFRKTIRINDKIWEQFSKFCDEHKEFTQKDLVSQALFEYMQKYN